MITGATRCSKKHSSRFFSVYIGSGSCPKMLATPIDAGNIPFDTRPKRLRLDTTRLRHYDANGVTERSLDINGVIRVLRKTDGSYDGGVNCSICGKLYKSRVCFVKHIWEHTIYWDLFPGDKNQDRVLSIQAALILFLPHMGTMDEQDCTILSHLLVTSPNEKKLDQDGQPMSPTSPVSSPDFKKRPKTPKKAYPFPACSLTSPGKVKRKKSFD